MDTDLNNALHKTVFVPWLPQEAFHIFTSCIGEWWPLKTHSLADKAKGEQANSIVIEPHAGARFYEVLADGQHRDWGIVLAYKPGEVLRLCWQMGKPMTQSTEIEIIFSPAGTQTKVDLIHRHWERLGDEGEEKKKQYNTGWDYVLSEFVSFAKTHEAA